MNARAIAIAKLAVLAVACSRPGSPVRSGDPAPDAAARAPSSDEAAAPPVAVVASLEPPSCDETPGAVHLFVSPRTPVAGAPLRVLAYGDRPLAGELRVSAGGTTVSSDARRGGPPWFWLAEVETAPPGPWTATFAQRACADHGASIGGDVVKVARAPAPSGSGLWASSGAWTHALENVYSAWIEALFDAPDGEQPSWPALHEVLRDPRRNVLHDHLGLGEDGAKTAPVIRPDCADLPYFLRAYFAWKLGLPFGLAECNRGGGGLPPSCKNLVTNEDADERAERMKKDGPTAAFGAFLRGTLADKAHSGSARAPFEDEGADYYPVRLAWETLRPGTVYADPYGHVLVVQKRIAQTPAHGGVLYAVDGQPDGTVARKRFWRGNFLYATQRELGGPGFKHFRPVARRGGRLARLDDAAIAASAEYADVSRDAAKLDVEGFYDAMDDVLSPRPLDPERAMRETIDALEEQVRTRVQSVDNGRRWLDKRAQPAATMPDEAEIFETTGPWEDFSTPSRDLRLLIAIDVVRGFPARVARRRDRYAAGGKDTDLARVLEVELGRRSVTYTRTDGSPFTLTLAEVLARSPLFETAYNPNDCVEARWGAPAGSAEVATCRAHAPADQRTRMESYRAWFRDWRRPPRK